jgi:coenzyme F420 hydrogenase subunit beta
MLNVNSDFVLGKIKGICKVNVQNEDPLEFLLKKFFELEVVDGVLTADKNGKPALFASPEKLTVSKTSFFGVNAYLKKAIQKYRFSKLCVVGPSCILDGLNKTQYYGIGCNWVKTAVALKVGIVCVGTPVGEGEEVEVMDLTGKRDKVLEYKFTPSGFKALTREGEIEIPLSVHHSYVNSACKYCFNLSAKGADISYIRNGKYGIFIVRSERGWKTLWLVQRSFPEECSVELIGREGIAYVERILKEKVLLNVDSSLERFESGFPEPKWNTNRFAKLYRIWNTLEDSNIEEVF